MIARANPGLCVGAHLNTIGEWRGYRWRTVLPYNQVNTLVDKNGFLYQTPAEFFSNKVDYDQLEREFMAQADLIANGWGVDLGYMDWHYSSGDNYGAREYMQVIKRVAKTYDLPISSLSGDKMMKNIYDTEPEQKEKAFLESLDGLTPGLWFSMHHLLQNDPEALALKYSDATDEMPGGTAKHRAAEACVLTSRTVRDKIEALGIKMINYNDVKPWFDIEQTV